MFDLDGTGGAAQRPECGRTCLLGAAVWIGTGNPGYW